MRCCLHAKREVPQKKEEFQPLPLVPPGTEPHRPPRLPTVTLDCAPPRNPAPGHPEPPRSRAHWCHRSGDSRRRRPRKQKGEKTQTKTEQNKNNKKIHVRACLAIHVFGQLPNTAMAMRTALPYVVTAGALLVVTHFFPSPPSCTTHADCSLNGLCTAGRCACDRPWGGPQCGVLQYKQKQAVQTRNLYPLNATGAPAAGPCVTSTSVCEALNTWNGPIVRVGTRERESEEKESKDRKRRGLVREPLIRVLLVCVLQRTEFMLG